MSDKANEYVLGFLFDVTGSQVLLRLKNRPDWQRNKFNGIGGHVKEGETPEQAMCREFAEETTDEITDWRRVCFLRGSWGVVSVFAAYYDGIAGVEGDNDEPVQLFPAWELPDNAIPNVRWLVPMCLSFARGEHANYFEVKEV